MTRTPWVAMLAIALGGAACWVGPFLFRADLFDGDAAHHIFWLYRYADARLFPGDVTVDYFLTSAPAGYQALYALLVPWIDAMFASKLVSFGLFAASVVLAYAAGAAVPGPDAPLRGLLASLGLVLMLALSTQTDSLAPMGMQRAFGLPTTLLALWGLVSGRYWLVGVSWLLAALTYPVVLPVIGLAAGAVFLHDLVRNRRLPSYWLVNGFAAVAAVALALFAVPKAPQLGPAASYLEAMAMPGFGPDGRLDLWGPAEGALFWHGMTGLGWAPKVVVLVGACVAGTFVVRQRWLLPFAAWALLGVGVLLWVALRVWPEHLMFGLYLPNRHPRWAIPAFGALAFAAVTYGLLALRSPAARGVGPGVARAVAVCAPLLAIAALLPRSLAQWERPVEADLQRTYAFLATLPADTLVAAHPDTANYVPLFARRSVLASTEASMPWMKGYFAIMQPRLEASLHAAYATSVESLDQLLAPLGVGYFVVGPEAWSRDGYLQPWREDIRRRQAEAQQAGRPLEQVTGARVVFESGGYRVLRVGDSR
jgi:hypothetical protein